MMEQNVPQLPSSSMATSCIVQPASAKSLAASRMCLRESSGVALTGFFHSVVNTSGGTSLLTSLRISSSRPCGRPLAASSELSK